PQGVRAARYAPGEGWGTATWVQTDAVSPVVGVDAAGNAMSIHRALESGRQNLWSVRYIAGSGWWGGERIEESTGADVIDYDLAMNAVGDAVAVWVDDN